ncbi:MAG: hypothetical protein ACUVTL_10925, partial [Thermoproteota archaeon]
NLQFNEIFTKTKQYHYVNSTHIISLIAFERYFKNLDRPVYLYFSIKGADLKIQCAKAGMLV